MRDRIPAMVADRRMILIPAGPFLFGPRKIEVTLREFWIDPYPVTNAELARVWRFVVIWPPH